MLPPKLVPLQSQKTLNLEPLPKSRNQNADLLSAFVGRNCEYHLDRRCVLCRPQHADAVQQRVGAAPRGRSFHRIWLSEEGFEPMGIVEKEGN